jgi:hypothetical protein
MADDLNGSKLTEEIRESYFLKTRSKARMYSTVFASPQIVEMMLALYEMKGYYGDTKFFSPNSLATTVIGSFGGVSADVF